LRRNGSFSRTHNTPGITSMTSSGPGGFSQGYRSASAEDWGTSVFAFIVGRRKFAAIGLAAQSAGRQPKKTAIDRECAAMWVLRRQSGYRPCDFGHRKQKGRHECRPFPEDLDQSQDQ
jgi:hypothetical protein